MADDTRDNPPCDEKGGQQENSETMPFSPNVSQSVPIPYTPQPARFLEDKVQSPLTPTPLRFDSAGGGRSPRAVPALFNPLTPNQPSSAPGSSQSHILRQRPLLYYSALASGPVDQRPANESSLVFSPVSAPDPFPRGSAQDLLFRQRYPNSEPSVRYAAERARKNAQTGAYHYPGKAFSSPLRPTDPQSPSSPLAAKSRPFLYPARQYGEYTVEEQTDDDPTLPRMMGRDKELTQCHNNEKNTGPNLAAEAPARRHVSGHRSEGVGQPTYAAFDQHYNNIKKSFLQNRQQLPESLTAVGGEDFINRTTGASSSRVRARDIAASPRSIDQLNTPLVINGRHNAPTLSTPPLQRLEECRSSVYGSMEPPAKPASGNTPDEGIEALEDNLDTSWECFVDWGPTDSFAESESLSHASPTSKTNQQTVLSTQFETSPVPLQPQDTQCIPSSNEASSGSSIPSGDIRVPPTITEQSFANPTQSPQSSGFSGTITPTVYAPAITAIEATRSMPMQFNAGHPNMGAPPPNPYAMPPMTLPTTQNPHLQRMSASANAMGASHIDLNAATFQGIDLNPAPLDLPSQHWGYRALPPGHSMNQQAVRNRAAVVRDAAGMAPALRQAPLHQNIASFASLDAAMRRQYPEMSEANRRHAIQQFLATERHKRNDRQRSIMQQNHRQLLNSSVLESSPQQAPGMQLQLTLPSFELGHSNAYNPLPNLSGPPHALCAPGFVADGGESRGMYMADRLFGDQWKNPDGTLKGLVNAANFDYAALLREHRERLGTQDPFASEAVQDGQYEAQMDVFFERGPLVSHSVPLPDGSRVPDLVAEDEKNWWLEKCTRDEDGGLRAPEPEFVSEEAAELQFQMDEVEMERKRKQKQYMLLQQRYIAYRRAKAAKANETAQAGPSSSA
ncbi:hypothetical protein EJ04DRAFT_589400 [Polyplosphaeria fusca]|uniref:Uncharacterized protein n=1 Tax=Polyplosphaeria fusca TaxID=682080 RepID=A0A9P4QMJ6_9PLEO|nr:hypothetical protein EJ04DRAFT_589400 [Polyplosphaeria fusca]